MIPNPWIGTLTSLLKELTCRSTMVVTTSTMHWSKRGDDTALGVRLRKLAQQRRRLGYRRLHILLLRDGETIDRKRTHWLYTEEGLTLHKRKSRPRVVGARALLPIVVRPSHSCPQRALGHKQSPRSLCRWLERVVVEAVDLVSAPIPVKARRKRTINSQPSQPQSALQADPIDDARETDASLDREVDAGTPAVASSVANWNAAMGTISFDWPAIEQTAAAEGPNQVIAKLLLAARAEGANSRWPF